MNTNFITKNFTINEVSSPVNNAIDMTDVEIQKVFRQNSMY
jgi:hypothetical protein